MNSQVVLLIIGAILPPFIDLVNRFVPSSNWRFVVSVLFSVMAGAVLSYFDYGFNAVLADAGLLFTASQTIYKLWYENSSLQRVARGA